MFNLHTSWHTILLAAAVCIISLYASFKRWRGTNGSGAGLLASELARFAALAMICLSLLQLEWITTTRETLKPEVVILGDISDSMNTADILPDDARKSRTPITRKQWIAEKLAANFPKKLEPQFKTTTQRFSMPPSKNGKSPTDGTDISYALSGVLRKKGNVRALILLSDGSWNAGASPVGPAAELNAKRIKIFAVGVGRESWLPDLELRKVKAPAFCLSNEKVAIPFMVVNHLRRKVSTKITLQSDDGGDISKQIEIPPLGSVRDTIIWRPGTKKSYKLSLSVPVQEDELSQENNRTSFKIDVRDEKLKVLLIDSLPRWEYRYLRNALVRDPGIDVNTILYLPKIGIGDGKGYLRKFPDKKLLSTFDVVFLGDVGIGQNELTKKQADMLAELVEQQGSGLVFLPGRRGRIYSLTDTKLWDLCPVVPDPSGEKGYHSGIASKMTLTGTGRSHFLMMLADTPSLNDYVWRRLPGFFWNARVLDAKPGSEVLAVHSGLKSPSGRMPLIVIAERGNGNVLFMGTDSAWRWRKGVEDKYHYRFWGQVVRWMAHKRHLAGDQGIRCFYVPESPAVGQKVTLYATLRDRSGNALDGLAVSTVLSPKNAGTARTTRLRQKKTGWGLYKGSFVPDSPGTWKAAVNCPETNSKLNFEIEVAGINRERVGAPANFKSLREIAAITRGKFFDTADFAKLIDTVKGLPKRQPLTRISRIWCQWWWGAIIILLLTFHWTMRKLRGEL